MGESLFVRRGTGTKAKRSRLFSLFLACAAVALLFLIPLYSDTVSLVDPEVTLSTVGKEPSAVMDRSNNQGPSKVWKKRDKRPPAAFTWGEDCLFVEEKDESVSYDEENDDSGEDDQDEEDKESDSKDRLIASPDKLTLGRCHYINYKIFSPPRGYLKEIDYYLFRKTQWNRQECYLYCIDQLDSEEVTDELLIDASRMGLTRVVKKLKTSFELDPLFVPTIETEVGPRIGLNAIQQAIHGGYAEIVKVLTDSNNDMVIDKLGRTVADYVRMKGSPILPEDAAKVLSLKVSTKSDAVKLKRKLFDSGWNQETSLKVEERCDIDVIDYGDMTREAFYNDYFMPGRPFLLRGAIPAGEIRAFRKSRWKKTKRFNPRKKVQVGPAAYPEMTGQSHCSKYQSIAEMEHAAPCEEMPDLPMIRAFHPSKKDMRELYPMTKGNVYDKKGGWRMLEEWFGPPDYDEQDLTWQVFFGGDRSGVSLHWHDAAISTLYTGIKEWRISPPMYRGLTGMPALKASQRMDKSTTLHCTQHPGDVIYIPNYWGHLTINHGFSIGTAVVLPDSFQNLADAKGIQKVFFVHINKTGGSSLVEMLQEHCEYQYDFEWWGEDHRTFHASATSFIDHYGRDTWNSAYRFSVVRHPLARQVSNFFFLLDRCSEYRRQSCKERLIPRLDVDSLTDDEKISSFHKYTQMMYEKFPPGSRDHYLFGSRGHGNEEFDTFNATQTSWLVDDDDRIAVDHIFHLENLSQDMAQLANAVPCLKGSGDEGEVKMIHENKTPRYPDYRLFGKNKQTNRIMKEVYAVDFKNFGYKLK